MKKRRLFYVLLIVAVLVLLIGYWAVANQRQPSSAPEVLIDNSETQGTDAAQKPADSAQTAQAQEPQTVPEETQTVPREDAYYYSPEDVALYLHLYGHLPDNYITKDEATALGWDSQKGNLWDVADGMCIGGDRFGNYEGQLPRQRGRTWYECDVNYEGGYRGGERIVYSTDGLIYYTADHYATFEQLY